MNWESQFGTCLCGKGNEMKQKQKDQAKMEGKKTKRKEKASETTDDSFTHHIDLIYSHKIQRFEDTITRSKYQARINF